MPVSTYDPSLEKQHRQEVDDASCFVYEASLDWVYPPAGHPNSEKRSLRMQVTQTTLDAQSSILRNLQLPLEFLLEDETAKRVHFDRFGYDAWGQFLYHGWRIYNKEIGCYVDENGQPCDDRFHNDSNPTKSYEFGEPMRIMAGRTCFPRRIEENPAMRGLKENTLWKLFPNNRAAPMPSTS